MNKKISKLLYLAEACLFAAATFQIVSEHYIPGAIFFAVAACFASAAGIYQKREKNRQDEKESEEAGNEP